VVVSRCAPTDIEILLLRMRDLRRAGRRSGKRERQGPHASDSVRHHFTV